MLALAEELPVAVAGLLVEAAAEPLAPTVLVAPLAVEIAKVVERFPAGVPVAWIWPSEICETTLEAVALAVELGPAVTVAEAADEVLPTKTLVVALEVLTADALEVKVENRLEDEVEPPEMWNGKEYWKVAGSESSWILKP